MSRERPGGLDFRTEASAAPARDAVSVVLLRDSARGLEVLTVRRSDDSPFLPGYVVFPGGKVDAADFVTGTDRAHAGAAPTWPAQDGALNHALAVAALRETCEEVGYIAGVSVAVGRAITTRTRTGERFADLLDDATLGAGLHALTPLSRWITPAEERRRFDSRIFLSVVDSSYAPHPDLHEVTRTAFATPTEVLGQFDHGDVLLVPPTHYTLTWLRAFASAAEAQRAASAFPKYPIEPRIRPCADVEGDKLILLPGDPSYAAPETDGRPRPSADTLVLPLPHRYRLRAGVVTAEPTRGTTR